MITQKSYDLEFKICIIGCGGVGKTSFCKRFKTNEFDSKYIPTIGAEIYHIYFTTKYGIVKFNLWDTAGQEKFGSIRDGYYINANAFIILFDTTSRSTYSNVPRWYRNAMRICPNVPVILCGNKTDIMNSYKIQKKDVKFKQQNVQYYEISVKNEFNLNKPFLEI